MSERQRCSEHSGVQNALDTHSRELKTLFSKVDAIGARTWVILGGVLVTLLGVIAMLLKT